MALKSDFENYSEVYGDSSNRQMLLNLAREAHEEPINFIQLAQISSQYSFMLGGGFTSSDVNNIPGFYRSGTTMTTGSTPPTGGNTITRAFGTYVKNALTLGGSANTSLTQNPIFQFVPLTGTNFSQAVLFPIPEKVFDTFYDQNWRADWLARIMVESVAIENITTNTESIWITNYETKAVLRTNSYNAIEVTNNGVISADVHFDISPIIETNYDNPLTNYKTSITTFKTNYTYWVNDPNNPTYPNFLWFCDTLRYAQENHYIGLEQQTGSNVVYTSTNTKLADVVSALAAGLL
jgi:hypothetical protein